MSDHPFFLWSTSEAWAWLVHVPALGFMLLVVGVIWLLFAGIGKAQIMNE